MRTQPFSSAARSRFIEDGYLAIPDAVGAATLATLRDAAESTFCQVVGTTIAERLTHPRLTWWRLADGRAYVFKIKPVVDLVAVFRDIAAADETLGLASAILGADALLMEDKVTYKTPVNADTGWADLPVLGEDVRKHSDAAYFTARGFGRVVTVALCLDDSPAAAGALRVWPGSHRRPVVHLPTQDQGPVVPDEAAPDGQAVVLEAAAGTVLAWDSALVHASGPNRTANPRRLFVLGYTTGPR